MSISYVTRMRMCRCDKSSMANYLNIEEDHGVMYRGQPVLNANDFDSNKNITHFGTCGSKANPGNSLNPLMASGLGLLLTGLEQMMNGGCKCNPKTFIAWKTVKDSHLIEGAPALTDESVLTCFYGGKIKIISVKDQEEAGL